MAKIFPKLVKKFMPNGEEATALLKLEPWKKVEEEIKEKPVDYRHPCSFNKYFVKSIRLPSDEDKTVCSKKCFKRMSKTDLIKSVGQLSVDNILALKIKKCTARHENFLNTLFLKNEEDNINDFCKVASQYEEKTCSEWFEFLMEVSNHVEEQKDKSYTEKKRSFNAIIKKEKLPTVIAVKPCCHFGPCGPNIPDCSCKSFCSAYCQCDDNCVRKLPGCNCPPGQCGKAGCLCFEYGWECIGSHCKKCHDPSNKYKCRNNAFHRGEDKPVRIGPSTIVVDGKSIGNGAFSMKDIRKGEYIGAYLGEHISAEEVERRGKLAELGRNYVFTISNTWDAIDSSRAGNALRFVNHSKRPNCYALDLVVHGKPLNLFYAQKSIHSGEEMTLSYGKKDVSDRYCNGLPYIPDWKYNKHDNEDCDDEADTNRQSSSSSNNIPTDTDEDDKQPSSSSHYP